MSEEQPRLALLIDSDNVSASRARDLIEELTSYGTLTVRRAYGDWSSAQLGGWRNQLHGNAITPIQQFANTKGKNSTDSALIIDAMDLLYSGHLDGFVIVSSDSDFTRLATRLRESGKVVYGVGERKTPRAFVEACDRFLYLENLGADRTPAGDASAGDPTSEVPGDLRDARDPGDARDDAPTSKLTDNQLQSLIHRALNQSGDDDGWASMAALGNQLLKIDPSFDPRTYGHAKLTSLIKSLPYLETRSDENRPGRGRLYARMK